MIEDPGRLGILTLLEDQAKRCRPRAQVLAAGCLSFSHVRRVSKSGDARAGRYPSPTGMGAGGCLPS